MRFRWALGAAVLALGWPLATAVQSLATDNVVVVSSSGYRPQTLTVPAGATVTWRNADTRQHTVTSDTGAFTECILYPPTPTPSTLESHCQRPFPNAGTYGYFDADSPGHSVKGTIIVTASPSPSPSPSKSPSAAPSASPSKSPSPKPSKSPSPSPSPSTPSSSPTTSPSVEAAGHSGSGGGGGRWPAAAAIIVVLIAAAWLVYVRLIRA